jgi:hypothetical protein
MLSKDSQSQITGFMDFETKPEEYRRWEQISGIYHYVLGRVDQEVELGSGNYGEPFATFCFGTSEVPLTLVDTRHKRTKVRWGHSLRDRNGAHRFPKISITCPVLEGILDAVFMIF